MRKKRKTDERKEFRLELKQRLQGVLDRAVKEKDFATRAGTFRGGIEAIISSLEK